jgi:excisionase family DNA binding protein
MDEFRRKERVPLAERISLSPEEASAITGIGLTRIREAASRGDLEAHKHGRRTIILREDLATWIRAMPTAADAKAPFETERKVASMSALTGIDSMTVGQAVGTGDLGARKRRRKATAPIDNLKAERGKARMQMQKQIPVKKR